MSPDDPFDEATADMISDGVVDLHNGVFKFYFETDEAKKVLSCNVRVGVYSLDIKLN